MLLEVESIRMPQNIPAVSVRGNVGYTNLATLLFHGREILSPELLGRRDGNVGIGTTTPPKTRVLVIPYHGLSPVEPCRQYRTFDGSLRQKLSAGTVVVLDTNLHT